MVKRLKKIRLKYKRFQRLSRPQKIRRFKLLSKHPFMVPVVTLLILAGLSAGIYALASKTNKLPVTYDTKIVIINHDHQQQIVPSKEDTVGQLLSKLHITINQGDVVEPALATHINQDEFRVNIYRAVPVEIVDGTTHTYGYSAATTGRSIAEQAGVAVYPEDYAVVQPVDNFMKSGAITQQVVISRATPVNVDLYGTNVVLRTHANTVAGLMQEKHIKLIKNDKVEPSPSTPIVPGESVAFIRTGIKVETVTETIAMPIQTINDSSLAYGTSAVRQQGSDGQQVVTYQISLKNNVETGRTILQKVVTKQPVLQIDVVGSSLSGIKGDMALAGIAPGDYQYADYIISHESGWCPTKAQGQYGSCPPYAGYVPSYGGYGLCQSTPGSKMASAGADWATNPITQLRWCSGYAQRYGGWAGAYSHWIAYHNW